MMILSSLWALPLLALLVNNPLESHGQEEPPVASDGESVAAPPPADANDSPEEGVPRSLPIAPGATAGAFQSKKQESGSFAEFKNEKQEQGIFVSYPTEPPLPPLVILPMSTPPPELPPLIMPTLPPPIITEPRWRPKRPRMIPRRPLPPVEWSLLFCDCVDSLITNPSPNSGVERIMTWLQYTTGRLPHIGSLLAPIVRWPIRIMLTGYKFSECMFTCYAWRLFKIHLWIAAWIPYTDPTRFYAYIVSNMIRLIRFAMDRSSTFCLPSGPKPLEEVPATDVDYSSDYSEEDRGIHHQISDYNGDMNQQLTSYGGSPFGGTSIVQNMGGGDYPGSFGGTMTNRVGHLPNIYQDDHSDGSPVHIDNRWSPFGGSKIVQNMAKSRQSGGDLHRGLYPPGKEDYLNGWLND